MKSETLKAFSRSFAGATEDVKWGADHVFSVGDKMFVVFPLEEGNRVSFKTTAANFAVLTGMDGIVPAPYVARYNWVLVEDLDALPEEALQDLIEESYQLVFDRLPLKKRKAIMGNEA